MSNKKIDINSSNEIICKSRLYYKDSIGIKRCGRLAQLDSAPVYGTGGCVFESRGDRLFFILC